MPGPGKCEYSLHVGYYRAEFDFGLFCAAAGTGVSVKKSCGLFRSAASGTPLQAPDPKL